MLCCSWRQLLMYIRCKERFETVCRSFYPTRYCLINWLYILQNIICITLFNCIKIKNIQLILQIVQSSSIFFKIRDCFCLMYIYYFRNVCVSTCWMESQEWFVMSHRMNCQRTGRSGVLFCVWVCACEGSGGGGWGGLNYGDVLDLNLIFQRSKPSGFDNKWWQMTAFDNATYYV